MRDTIIESQLYIFPPPEIDTVRIRYQDSVIGVLQYLPKGYFNREGYLFVYDEQLQQKGCYILPGLYQAVNRSETLWFYFIARMPNPNTPAFKDFVSTYHVSEAQAKNFLLLLCTLGRPLRIRLLLSLYPLSNHNNANIILIQKLIQREENAHPRT